MDSVETEMGLPEAVEIYGYERIEDGHAFEVRWPLPETCMCEGCLQRALTEDFGGS